MPKFVIEREMPNVGDLTQEQLQEAAQKSCDVLREMGPEVQWIHSYVTDNKIYCVYHAADEAMIKQHAEKSGFPADKISKVKTVIDPATAEASV